MRTHMSLRCHLRHTRAHFVSLCHVHLLTFDFSPAHLIVEATLLMAFTDETPWLTPKGGGILGG